MTEARPNTPGPAGYVLAVALACGVSASLTYAVTAVVTSGPDEGGNLVIAVMAAIIYLPLLALVAATFGLPVAFVGVLVVHLCLRRVGGQRWHVVAAGVVGTVLALGYLTLWDLGDVGGPPELVIAAAVGIGAAAGRIAVLPLVESRRRLAAQGRLRGVIG